MSAMVPSKKDEKSEDKSTNVGRFLAKRGILLIKEFRDMLPVRGEYGGKLGIASVTLSSAKSIRGDVQYGIKFEHLDDESNIRASGFLDYDEVAEVIGAFDFLNGVAGQMINQERDYTEVTYSTKDNLKFGFYQLQGHQQGFIDVGGYGESLFMSVSNLQLIRKSIDAATQHLVSRGAEQDSVQPPD
jgi:hypothetical protein